MAFPPSTQYNLDAEDYHNCDSCDLINGRGIPLISLVAFRGRTQVDLGRRRMKAYTDISRSICATCATTLADTRSEQRVLGYRV
jgi:hypothetical protein